MAALLLTPYFCALFLFVKVFLFILFYLLAVPCFSQVRADSLLQSDSARRVADSISKDSVYSAKLTQFVRRIDTAVYSHHPFIKFKNPVKHISSRVTFKGKDTIFYGVVLLFLIFGFIKNSHLRYLKDLMRIFFRTTLRQRQIRDQLMGASQPSLLFNILFLLSGAFFITLLFRYYGLGKQYYFWMLYGYSFAALLFIYLIKYISLKLFGLLLRLSEAAETYIFVVFTTNKIIGIILLPFIVGIAFTGGQLNQIFVTLGIIVIVGLYVYRFYLSYISLHKQIKVSFFHFMVYLSAFEVVPLLLINKLLVQFFSETY